MDKSEQRNIAHMLLCIRDRTPDPLDARVLGDAADFLRQCAEQPTRTIVIPLPGLAPTHRCIRCNALWRQCDDHSWNLRSAHCGPCCDGGDMTAAHIHPLYAFPQPAIGEQPEPTTVTAEDVAAYNKAIDECYGSEPSAAQPLSDEQITKGEYVLATKFGDGDPGDHWGVGFYDRFENGRYYVVDSAGKQIRGNGFRRVGRITVEVGRWLLSAAKSLEASPPGTVNLWTMLTKRAHGIGGSDAE